MSEQEFDYDSEIEEIDPEDVTIYEGEPEFEDSPSNQTADGRQDDEEDSDA